MAIASNALLSALILVGLAQCGLSACSSDAGGGGQAAGGGGVAGAVAGGAAGAATSGAAGAAVAGASSGAGFGGASAGAGGASAGTGGSAAGTGGSNAGAGGASGSAGSAGSGGTGGSAGAAPFALTSPSLMNKAGCGPNAVASCDQFAQEFLLTTQTGGQNHSPELDWTAGPAGTLSYAIVLFDESNMYPHWAIWNIPATTFKLPASLPAGSNPAGITGAKQVSFNGSKDAYAGPGAPSHVYQFKLYALKVATISPTLPNTDPQKAVRTLLEGSADVLAKVELVGASPP